ncbi:hypothetical protein BU25DRAFT_407799 [Macroventuria anomochaeta]|uniref:Uncharacterized protein n=1 Tax=Macroventuria anomochaeta TaxID=301207 RepID=A0ACB6SB54_9PLEO|nr:uncharacterized protein BU25DRAFT_407799 [Macroventuria anomochaeta]KAF2631278.1 hypothetical protein BU25DRAFT_407799 [Macroventuria anomochaeta]
MSVQESAIRSIPSYAAFFGMLYALYFLSFVLHRPVMAMLGLLDSEGQMMFRAWLWDQL